MLKYINEIYLKSSIIFWHDIYHIVFLCVTIPSLTLGTKQNARIISKINGSGVFLILKFSRTFF